MSESYIVYKLVNLFREYTNYYLGKLYTKQWLIICYQVSSDSLHRTHTGEDTYLPLSNSVAIDAVDPDLSLKI